MRRHKDVSEKKSKGVKPRCAHLSKVLLILLGTFSFDVLAATCTVNSTLDTNTLGTLRNCLLTAASGDTISFSLATNSTITVTSDLPWITQDSLTIDASNVQGLTISGANAVGGTTPTYSLFVINNPAAVVSISGNSTSPLSLKYGLAKGGNGGASNAGGGGGAMGAGGALFVGQGATVTVANVHVQNNQATGGNGGTGNSGSGGGGGGGGMWQGTGGAQSSTNNGGGGGGGVGSSATGGASGTNNGGVGTVTGGATGGNGGAGYTTGGSAGGNGGATGGGGGGGGANTNFGGGGGGGGGINGTTGGDGTNNLGGLGGAGGFGGGGGGAGGFGNGTNGGTAGAGGFGGGGGGASAAGTRGIGGFGGGDGGQPNQQGGGGSAFGGGIFSMGNLTIAPSVSVSFATNGVTGGSGSTTGAAEGLDLYVYTGTTTRLSPAASQTLTFNGGIGGVGGAVLLNNAGTVVYASGGTFTYTGGTTISNGVLSLAAANKLPTTGELIVNGGTVNFNNNNQTIGALSGTGGTLSLGNAVLTFGTSADKAIASAITGTGILVKQGTGTQTFTNARTYSGGTQINAGTITANDNVALGTGTITFNGGALNTGTAGTTLTNSIAVGSNGGTLSGSNNISLTPTATFVLSGTLGITNTATTTLVGSVSDAITGSGGINVSNALSNLTISGNNAFSGVNTFAGNALSVGSTNALGTGALNLNNGTLSASTGVILGNNVFNVGGSGATIGGSNNVTITNTNGGTLTANLAITNTAVTTLNGAYSGTGGLTLNAPAGTLVMGGNNSTYNGVVDVTQGTLTAGNATNALGVNVLNLNGGALNSNTAAVLGNSAFNVTAASSITTGQDITITNGGTLGNTLTVTNANRTTTLNGVLTGTGSLVMNANGGTLIVSGNNTYSGNTTLTLGTLQANHNSAFGTGALTINGGTLSAGSNTPSVGNAYTVAGNAAIGGGNNLTLSGLGTLNALLTHSNTATTTLSGTLSGNLNGAITQTAGAGNLILSNNNTYSAGTNITGGTLTANNNNALGTGAINFSNNAILQTTVAGTSLTNVFNIANTHGTIGGAANIALVPANDSTLTGTLNISNTGTTTLGGGAGRLAGGGSININSSAGMVTLLASTNGVNTYSGTTTIGSGTVGGSLKVNNGALGTSTLAFNGGGLLTDTANTTLTNLFTVANVSGNKITGATDITLNGAGTLNGLLTIDNTQTTTLGGVLANGGTNGSLALATTAGTVVISSNNTYSGGTTLNGGTLVANSNTALGANTGVITFANDAILQTTVANTTLSNPFVVNSTGGRIGGTQNFSLVPASASTLTGILTITNTATTTLGGGVGIISGAGGINVTNANATLVMMGANTYSGVTTFAGNTLSIGTTNALGTVGAFNLNNGTLSAIAPVTLGNSAFNVGGAGASIGGNNNLTITNGGAISANLTVTNTATTTLNGNFTGSGALTLNTALGTLIMSGNNSSYTGAVSLTDGTLSVNNATNALGIGALTLNGGVLRSNTPATLGNATFNVAGASTIGGANNLTITNGGALSNTLTVTNTGTTTLNGVLTGTGALTLNANAGTLVVTGNNTYTGDTTLTLGNLEANHNKAFGTSALNLAGGTLRAGTSTPLLANAYTVSGATILGGVNNFTLSGAGTLNAALTHSNTATTTLSGVVSGNGSITNTLGNLILSDANSYTGGTNINGGTVTANDNSALGAAASVVTFANNGVLSTTVPAGVTLTNTLNVTNTNGTIGGSNTIVLAPNANSTLTGTLTISNTGTTTLGGNAGVLGGIGNIAIASTAGTVTILGANTYSGTTTLGSGTVGGTLKANNNTALGTSTLAFNGGTLTTDNAGTILSNIFTVANGVGGKINGTLDLTLSGAGTLNGPLTLDNSGQTTLSGNLLNGATNGSIVIPQTAGTVILSGNNAYAGGTVLNGGTLIANSNTALGANIGALIFANNAVLTTTVANTALANPFTVNATGGKVSGAQSLTLNGAGSLLGTLTIDNTATTTLMGALSNNGGLVIQTTGDVGLNATSNAYTGSVQLNSGTVTVGNNNALGVGVLTVNGGSLKSNTAVSLGNTFAIASAATIEGTNNITFSNPGAFAAQLTINSAGITTFNNTLSGAGSLNITAGTTQLGIVNNVFSGGTFLNGGILRTTIANAMPSTGAVTITTGSFDLNNFNQTIGDLSGAGGTVTLGAGNLTLGSATASTTYTGGISGAGGIIKQGSGTVILSGVNTYSGITTVNSGTLQLFANGLGSANINNGALVMMNNNAFAANKDVTIGATGIFNLNGFNQVLNNLSGNGQVLLGAGSLTVNGSTYAGNITGSGSLIKNGAGTLILSGNNNYTGGTTVSTGILQGNTTSLKGNILNNATVVFDQNTTGTYGGILSGNGATIKQNTGNLILSNHNTNTGVLSVNAGQLAVDGTWGGSVNVNSNATLYGRGRINGNVDVDGILQPGDLVTSSGTLTIGGDLTLGSNSNTILKIDPNGNSTALKLDGDAFLGGNLTIIPAPGNYIANTHYTFIDAYNVFGAFASAPQSIGPYRLGIIYDEDNAFVYITFNIEKISPLVIEETKNPNEVAVAKYIDSLPLPPVGSDLGDSIIGPLTNVLKGDELLAALESISPGRTAASAVVLQDFASLMNGITATRIESINYASSAQAPVYFNHHPSKHALSPLSALNQVKGKQRSKYKSFNSTRSGLSFDALDQFTPILQANGPQTGIWAYGLGHVASQKARGFDGGYSATTGGIMVGADHKPYLNMLIGVGLGHALSHIGFKNDAGSSLVDHKFVSVYGSLDIQKLVFDMSLVTDFVGIRNRQRISFLQDKQYMLNRLAKSYHHGYAVTPHAGVGYTFEIGQMSLKPFIGIDYSHSHENGYVTKDANALNQSIAPRTTATLRSEAGFKVATTYDFILSYMTGTWGPHGQVSFIHNRRIKTGPMKVGFVGEPGYYTVENFTSSRNQVAPGAGVAWKLNNGAYMNIGVHSEFGSKYRAYEVNLKAGLSF